MDFLKTCQTNAQAIGDFEAVAYRAFSIKRSTTKSSATFADRSPSEDVRAVEAELRQEQHLVIQDVSRPWIWLFRATTVDKTSQKPLDLPVIEGFNFDVEQSGVMKASELARPPMRTMHPMAGAAASVNSPSTARGSQTLGGRPGQNPDQQHPHDAQTVYELFTSSVIALISYHLIRDHAAIALNYRTFLSKAVSDSDSDGDRSVPPDVPYRLINLSVYWASSGALIVSLYSLPKPEIRCLADLQLEDAQSDLIDSCVRVAPNGSLAKIVTFEEPSDTAADDFSQRTKRKRFKTGPVEQGLERWKTVVTRWLSWKGYSIPDLDKKTSWVRLRMAQPSNHVPSSPLPVGGPREILWPRALCFHYEPSSYLSSSADLSHHDALLEPEGALEWFETSSSTGFRDPIDVAQEWFLGKPERDRILEARRKAKRAEEEAARPKEEVHGLYPSSPLNSRTGAYGELQAVSGVYPTPPDGVLPGTGVSSSDHPSVPSTATNTVLLAGGNNPSINLSAPQDGVTADGQQQPATSPDFSLDNFATSGGNDDLFEDMEEDTYEGNGVTDADFNFFDEPDDNDADMQDALPAPASKTKSVSKGKAAMTEAPPELEAKEEGSDPLAALEDALASASRQSEEDGTPPKVEDDDEYLTSAEKDFDVIKPHTEVLPEKTAAPKLKDTTPPLSPHHIQQALIPSPEEESLVNGQHRDSVFDPVSFSRKITLSDAKYADGRFSFRKEDTTAGPTQDIESPKAEKTRPASLRDLPLLTKLRYAIAVASTKGIPTVKALERTDDDFSDTSSVVSMVSDEDVDDALSTSRGPPSAGLIGPGKRKLPTDAGNATPMSTTSFAESMVTDSQSIAGLQTDDNALASLEPNPWDWSLLNLPAPTEIIPTVPRNYVPAFSPFASSLPGTPTSQPDVAIEPQDEKPLSGKDSIAVVQIVTDQVVMTTLDLLNENSVTGPEWSEVIVPWNKWKGVIKGIFPKAIDCSVQMLIQLPDVYPDFPPQVKGQQRPPPRKPNETAPLPAFHLNQINPPHIRVRRAENLWDLLPPALSFWEPLGLAPCSAAKNVVAFCLHPYSEAIRPCLEGFLLNLQIAYEGCKLGTHTRVETLTEFEGGLVPWKMSQQSSLRGAFRSLRETCFQFGRLLASKHTQMRSKDEAQKIDAFVIYMVDPFETPSSVWELCSAFWTLFQAYGQSQPSANRGEVVQKPDVVLQIVPVKYIASFDTPVVLDARTYISLAREVYDRCPPSAPSEDKTPLAIYSAPSFQLEEAIPKAIPFKLNADAPQDLLRENSYIHLGYAISPDGAWVTAAWTDSCGKSQTVVSYNVGVRPFSEIAKEIWQTTIEILMARRVTWRVCVAKTGAMEREELETWIFLASCPTQLNLFITLLTVDTHPSLKFTPTPPPKDASNVDAKSTQLTTNTPGSTPQAGVSPDNIGLTPAATPSENAPDPSVDPEARLVDTTDDSWGIIFSHRLHNSNSTVEFRPSLISGLLVKRGQSAPTGSSSLTPDPEVGPVIVGVNILWVGAVGSTRATTSAFPTNSDGVSPGGATPSTPGPNPGMERSSSSFMWTPTVQSRNMAENLMKEVLGHFRALGTLAKLKGIRGTREGTVPWHICVAKRGVEGLGKCLPKNLGGGQ